MSVEPAALGDCGLMIDMIGEGWSADVMRYGDDAGGRMAPMADEKLTGWRWRCRRSSGGRTRAPGRVPS